MVIPGRAKGASPEPINTGLWSIGSGLAAARRPGMTTMIVFSSLRPEGETEPGAGAGRRAVARLVERPFERQVLDRAGDADPVADLRTARIELFARQPLDAGSVLAAEQVEEAAVERLVDDEMRQPT